MRSSELAAKYDSQPWQIDMTRKITAFIRENADTVLPSSSKKDLRLLDYACGTGMVTKVRPSVSVLRSHIKTVT